MIAYHFLKADFTAGRGDEEAWEIGEARTVDDPHNISLCKYGYHSSPTLCDALTYAPGPLACLVEVSDPVARDNDKQVSVTRKLLQAVNIERELRLFACDCAERVLHIYEKDCPDDPRPRMAIEAARRFADGAIGREELCAARDAAGAAAGAAAWDAAWDAARDAARDAAWAAAAAAAGAAAWDEAWDAAWAAWDAARDAAWSAAGAAARDALWEAANNWQRQHFQEMFGGIFTTNGYQPPAVEE